MKEHERPCTGTELRQLQLVSHIPTTKRLFGAGPDVSRPGLYNAYLRNGRRYYDGARAPPKPLLDCEGQTVLRFRRRLMPPRVSVEVARLMVGRHIAHAINRL